MQAPIADEELLKSCTVVSVAAAVDRHGDKLKCLKPVKSLQGPLGFTSNKVRLQPDP